MEAAQGAMKPREAAREAISYLKSHADESRAAGLQRYFKDPVDSYGIEYRPYKEWKKEFLARLTDHWTIREAVEFCETMIEDPHMEARGIGFQVVGAFVEGADQDLLDDKEDLIHKAVGWLLREAGKVDRDRLEAYLLAQGTRLPRTTLRYAIEKFPQEDRKRLLEATR